MTARTITLDEITVRGSASKVPYSPFGYLIAADATVYALTERWTHGIILALLYPELAARHGYEPPQRESGALDVFRYQQFELDHGYDLPVIRIALSQLLGGTVVSAGGQSHSEDQITALVATLAHQGLKANDTLTGEDADPTVADLVEELRQRRTAALQKGGAQ